MFTLFICITLDGWVEIFNTLRVSYLKVETILKYIKVYPRVKIGKNPTF